MQNSCDVLVKNAQAAVPKVGIIDCDIMIEDGRIKSLKAPANVSASLTIDATDKYVLPGLIDPHVHYGVYTPINEAAASESSAAAIGGVTTMMRMLRLYDDSFRSIGEQLAASEKTHHVDYAIHASILKPQQLSALPLLKEKGINSLKVYMNLGADLDRIYMDIPPATHAIQEGTVNMTDELLSGIVEQGTRNKMTILVHAEDPARCSAEISNARQSGLEGLRVWSDCRPVSSEAESISKVASLGRKFGSSLYFVHIGSSGALDAIIQERQKGNANYYIETCPQYLTHSHEDYTSLKGKVVPPMRSKHDVQAMWYALRNGIVDTIGTDHVANRLELKMGKGDTWTALAGFPGIGTMLPVLLDRGVKAGLIDLVRLAELTSYNSARIFGMYPKKGTIQEGSDADLTIVDLEATRKVSPEFLQSYSDYTIYDGWELAGWPVVTMVRGKIVMQDGVVSKDTLGHGEFVARPVADFS